VVIYHTGYQDEVSIVASLNENLSLLELEQAEHPNNAWTLLNLGQNLLALGRAAELCRFLRRGLDRSPRDDFFCPQAVTVSWPGVTTN